MTNVFVWTPTDIVGLIILFSIIIAFLYIGIYSLFIKIKDKIKGIFSSLFIKGLKK